MIKLHFKIMDCNYEKDVFLDGGKVYVKEFNSELEMRDWIQIQNSHPWLSVHNVKVERN